MSTVLDRLEELRAGQQVHANCPMCGQFQQWHNARPHWHRCVAPSCVFNLDDAPPVILCAVCGEVLHRSVHDDNAFTCQGCGRRVTA